MIFIVGYKFIMETSFSLDTGYFYQMATCRVIMFIMEYMLDYVIFLGSVKLIMTFSFHYSRFHAKL